MLPRHKQGPETQKENAGESLVEKIFEINRSYSYLKASHSGKKI